MAEFFDARFDMSYFFQEIRKGLWKPLPSGKSRRCVPKLWRNSFQKVLPLKSEFSVKRSIQDRWQQRLGFGGRLVLELLQRVHLCLYGVQP